MVALQEEQAEQHSSLTIGLSGLRTPSRASGGTQPIGVGNIADWGRICRQYIARVRTRWQEGDSHGRAGALPGCGDFRASRYEYQISGCALHHRIPKRVRHA